MTATIVNVAEALSRDLRSPKFGEGDTLFRERAACLLRDVVPALDWLARYKDFPTTIDTVRSAFEWRWIRTLATRRLVLLQDRRSGDYRAFCAVWDMPARLLAPFQRYVADMGILVVAGTEDPVDETAQEKLHSYVTMHFASGFTQLRCDVARFIV